VTFRRGFKAEADRISLEIRSELGLSATDALNIFALGKHLAIPIVPMSALAKTAEPGSFRRFFAFEDQESFSAITVFNASVRLIVHNESHHPNRQASNVAHEISHCLLEHKPAPLVGEAGCRHWDPVLESEADWLGAALLVPREGGYCLLSRGQSIPEIASNYGVSDALCRWRLHQTGAIEQLKRLKRWR
jgi:Zn-dependent peptidase ImmA (M78 family)